MRRARPAFYDKGSPRRHGGFHAKTQRNRRVAWRAGVASRLPSEYVISVARGRGEKGKEKKGFTQIAADQGADERRFWFEG